MSTPIEKFTEVEEAELDPMKTTMYRSICARVNYLAMDRFDIAYGAKELCRRMQKPDEGDWRALKRMGRYLKGRPRMTHKFL